MTKQDLFLALLCFASGCATAPLPSVSKKIPVWIDTDPSVGEKDRDVDDGLALIQSFHSQELEIRGVSVVFGNTALDRAYPIGKDIVDRFGPKGLQTYRGAAGASELGMETPASRALAQALKTEKLSILALGPVTNIGTVLKLHPDVKSNIVQIIAVAGRRPGQRFTTGTKNKKGHRDFNFEMDPEAFQTILETGVPLVLAPFEISSQVWITEDDLKRLETGDEGARWISPAARDWLYLWRRVFSVAGFNPFDTLAVGYLTNPGLLTCEVLPAGIRTDVDDSTEEQVQGVQVHRKPYLLVSSELPSKFRVTYCFKTSDRFKDVLMERLITGSRER